MARKVHVTLNKTDKDCDQSQQNILYGKQRTDYALQSWRRLDWPNYGRLHRPASTQLYLNRRTRAERKIQRIQAKSIQNS